MDISTILSPDTILSNLKPNSRRQLLQELASTAASHCEADKQQIFETLSNRERLGSTGVGNGVAIPHGKLPNIQKIMCVFARLSKPVDYDSIDDQPVDLVFVLLAPEGSGADHLKALSRIARLMREPSLLSQLRASTDSEALYALISEQEKASAA